ncbi:hypothetical protein [Helicobacter sp. 12S02634-8]|uniref:hypothetical protein n=1 Tax=Helicobacter sp. 12S02634-8 TaxID=1476199 RepID=UPI00117B8516|nr:hypothetical protein [Helicobacter sp. 12S02634-8]
MYELSKKVYEAIYNNFNKDQADALILLFKEILAQQTQIVRDAINEKIDDIIYRIKVELSKEFATKADLLAVKADLEASIAKLEQKLMGEISKIRLEMSEMKSELKQDVAELNHKFEKQHQMIIFGAITLGILTILNNPNLWNLFKEIKSIF